MTDPSQTIADAAIEQPLLAALIRRDPGPLAGLVQGNAALWEKVCARARDHRCLPYLYRVFDQAGVAAPVPFGSGLRQRWVLRALSIQRECRHLHDILSEAGIAHVFLKGVPLAVSAYPEPWLRPLRDIDLLVAPEDLARAQALLVDRGGPIERYAHKDETPGDPDAKHLAPVWSPGRVIAVELHGHAADAGSGLGLAALARLDAALWESAVDIPVGESTLPVPGPEALFVHLVMHGVYDHELNNGPLFVTDLIHLLERMPPDPLGVVALAGELGIERGLALALALVPEQTPGRAEMCDAVRAALSEGDALALSEDAAAALLLQDSAARTDLRLAADMADRTWGQRLRLMVRKTFPSHETMINRWRMEGHTAPPPARGLWLWFITVRLRGMHRSGDSLPRTRDHLMRLRALRDGRGP